jgi:Transglutaminase-like superfamily
MGFPPPELLDAPVPPRAQRLNAIERVRLATEIALAYGRVRRQLRRRSIESVLCSLRSCAEPSAEPLGPRTLADAQRLGRAVTRVLGVLPGDTRCLVRSLVLTQLLVKRGIPTKLVIGARTGPDFLAHAWVEYEGDPVLSPGDGSFGRLTEL